MKPEQVIAQCRAILLANKAHASKLARMSSVEKTQYDWECRLDHLQAMVKDSLKKTLKTVEDYRLQTRG